MAVQTFWASDGATFFVPDFPPLDPYGFRKWELPYFEFFFCLTLLKLTLYSRSGPLERYLHFRPLPFLRSNLHNRYENAFEPPRIAFLPPLLSRTSSPLEFDYHSFPRPSTFCPSFTSRAVMTSGELRRSHANPFFDFQPPLFPIGKNQFPEKLLVLPDSTPSGLFFLFFPPSSDSPLFFFREFTSP